MPEQTPSEKPVNKNVEKLASFTAYCQQHPDERFWQALRNWAQVNFIFTGNSTSNGGGTKVQIEGSSVYLKDTYND